MTHSTHTSPAQIAIRPARAADSTAIFAMVKHIWGGRDYVPEVWNSWLADTSGPLLVGEVDGQPVALAKISSLGPGEDWFHGMRVDPVRRGAGYARAMVERCVAISRERGARTLRYLTDEENKPMHHLADEYGFVLNYAPSWYAAPPRLGASRAVALAPAQAGRLRRELAASPLLARTDGMYAYGWRNLDLTPERLEQHLARGEVRALAGEPAWAIVTPRESGWELAHIEGEPEAMARLCADLRGTAEDATDEEYLIALLPPDTAAAQALAPAGFGTPTDPMRVYTLAFAPTP